MYRRLLLAVPGLLAVALSDASVAQPAKHGSRLNGEFLVETSRIPPRSSGHDCQAIAVALGRLKLAKDEFETSDAHAERMRALGGSRLYGGVELGMRLAFKHGGFSLPRASYDADERRMRVTVSPGGRNAYNGDIFNWVAVDVSGPKESTYRASNAYGVTALVTKRGFKTCGVGFTNRKYMALSTIEFTIEDVDPASARAIRDSISAFYVGRPAAPYIASIREYRSATIDFPVETNWEGSAVLIELEEVVLVNDQTGEVLARQ